MRKGNIREHGRRDFVMSSKVGTDLSKLERQPRVMAQRGGTRGEARRGGLRRVGSNNPDLTERDFSGCEDGLHDGNDRLCLALVALRHRAPVLWRSGDYEAGVHLGGEVDEVVAGVDECVDEVSTRSHAP